MKITVYWWSTHYNVVRHLYDCCNEFQSCLLALWYFKSMMHNLLSSTIISTTFRGAVRYAWTYSLEMGEWVCLLQARFDVMSLPMIFTSQHATYCLSDFTKNYLQPISVSMHLWNWPAEHAVLTCQYWPDYRKLYMQHYNSHYYPLLTYGWLIAMVCEIHNMHQLIVKLGWHWSN